MTLTGGNATFSPKTPGFGAATATGSDLSLSNINQQAAGSGIIMSGLRTLYLTGTNGFTGDTIINSGTLALTGSSSLTNSANIYVAGDAVLDVSGRTDGKLTLISGRTLAGNGTVRGSLAANPSATVSPGPSVGALTVTNVVTLAGITAMDIDKANATNDVIRGAASIQYGGTLSLSLGLGISFADGDSFKLFDATAYSGAFTSITPDIPGPGLRWDTSALTTSGTLKVAAAPAGPLIQSIAVSGGSVIVSGSNGNQGNNYFVLASTNIALPLSNWTILMTNQFGSGGSFSFTNAISPGVPQRFYLLQLP